MRDRSFKFADSFCKKKKNQASKGELIEGVTCPAFRGSPVKIEKKSKLLVIVGLSCRWCCCDVNFVLSYAAHSTRGSDSDWLFMLCFSHSLSSSRFLQPHSQQNIIGKKLLFTNNTREEKEKFLPLSMIINYLKLISCSMIYLRHKYRNIRSAGTIVTQ